MALKRNAVGYRVDDITDELQEKASDTFEDTACLGCGETTRVFIDKEHMNVSMEGMDELRDLRMGLEKLIEGAHPYCSHCAMKECPAPMREAILETHEYHGIETED